jgi:transcription elongation factor GreA
VLPPQQSQAILSRDGERALRTELDRLRHQLEVEFAARLREARAFGQSSENDDYLQIKEEEAVLASRIARLGALLETATVVNPTRRSSDSVTLGSVIEVEDLDSGAITEHRVSGGFEELSPGAISATSPLGSALIGRAVGEEVEARLPGGRTRRLRIRAIRTRPGHRSKRAAATLPLRE